jgi:hypothetical protein
MRQVQIVLPQQPQRCAVMTPVFIRVIPAEVKRYGAAAAVVAAHIRYRCASNNCIEHDGCRWWRVSYCDMGLEVGLSPKEVRTALRALGEIVVANHFPPLTDQSRAYRVITPETGSDMPEAQTGTWDDLPEAQTGTTPCPSGQPPVPQRASAPLSRELREEREARARQSTNRNDHPVPDPANAPKKFNRLKTDSQALGDLLTDPRLRSVTRKRPSKPQPQSELYNSRAQAAIDAARGNLDRATQQAHQKPSQEKAYPVCACGREILDNTARACDRCTPVINGPKQPNGNTETA